MVETDFVKLNVSVRYGNGLCIQEQHVFHGTNI